MQVIAAAGAVMITISFWVWFATRNPHYWLGYLVAFLLGSAVAVAELVSRYPDAPTAAMLSIPASVYVAVNAGASFAALFLIRELGQDFGQSGAAVPVVQVTAAGFGSAAIFRSSVFTVPAGGATIGIGPSAVLNVIMKAADRAVDRQRAAIRARQADVLMRQFSFKDGNDLVAFTLRAMQNLTAEESEKINVEFDQIAKADDRSERTKAGELCLLLLSYVGSRVLGEIVRRFLAHPERRVGGGVALGGPVLTDPVGAGNALDLSGHEMIVTVLEKHGGVLEIGKLRTEVALPLDVFSSTLEYMRRVGACEIEGEAGEETVRIVPEFPPDDEGSRTGHEDPTMSV